MTERGRGWMQRDAREFRVGPSRLRWTGDALEIDVDEIAVPLPRRVRGRIRVRPQGLCSFVTALDAAGRHRWGPIAPCSRIEVEFDQPGLRWQGHAYLDSNEGDEPIHRPFKAWDWARATLADGSTAVIYDLQPQEGPGRVIAERFAPDGSATAFDAPPRHELPRTSWHLQRAMRSEAQAPAQLMQSLEDTPFYARATVSATLQGEATTAIHETLDLPRVMSWPVRLMLPWRMPRRG